MRNSGLNAKFRLVPVSILTASACLAAALLFAFLVRPAAEVHSAGTINVTTTNDEYGTGPGQCSLREAIESINTTTSFGGCSNPGTADTIQLEDGIYLVTIPYVAGESNSEGSLMPRVSMTIRGQGARLNRGRCPPAFERHRVRRQAKQQPHYLCHDGPGCYEWAKGWDRCFHSRRRGCRFAADFRNMVVQANKSTGMDLDLAAEDVQVTIQDTVIRANKGGVYGGGLAVTDGGQVSLNRVSIYGNEADRGAGIFYSNQYDTDAMELTNVTIYGNKATTYGGGLYVQTAVFGGITLTNVTFDQNEAMTKGGSIYNMSSTVRMVNTIVANGRTQGGTILFNCDGNAGPNITSLGHNLASDQTCNLNQAGDQQDTAPGFDGGLSVGSDYPPVVPLLHNSPAVDAGDNSACPAVDQRGVSRPQGPRCDIGAYEFEPPTADDIVASGPPNTDIEITLQGNDPQSDPLQYWIESLPAKGSLYQYEAGSRGDPITAVPDSVWDDAGHRVIFVPAPDESGRPYAAFEYYVHDGTSRSAAATVNVDVAFDTVFVPILIKDD